MGSLYARGSAGIGQGADAKADKELTVRVTGAWGGAAIIAGGIIIGGMLSRTGSFRIAKRFGLMFRRGGSGSGGNGAGNLN